MQASERNETLFEGQIRLYELLNQGDDIVNFSHCAGADIATGQRFFNRGDQPNRLMLSSEVFD
jgi:hypothetical protein